jgi:DNA modification methylase
MSVLLVQGDARQIPLADESIHCCVTSPPYWGLRDYGVSGQIGLEKTPEEYIRVMVDVFREVKRILRDDGTLWLNMGDSYCSSANGNKNCDSSTLTTRADGTRKRDVQETGRIARDDSKGRGTSARCDGRGGHVYYGPKNQPNRLSLPGFKPKDLIGIPWMLAFALRADGWYLRSDIIWSKPNPMPESVTDRPTKAHEYIFLLSKCERYYYDAEAIKERVTGEAHARGDGVNPKAKAIPTGWDISTGNGGHGKIHKQGRNKQGEGHRRYAGFNERWDQREASRNKQNESFSSAVSGLVEKRNKRTVWEVNPQPFPEAHFATFPEELIKPCILAGCPAGGTVLDPFIGSGTTALVARNLQCNAVGLELNATYIEIAKRRLGQEVLEFA